MGGTAAGAEWQRPRAAARSPPRRPRAAADHARIHLPSRGELANLFFASLDTTVGGQGYEIALLNIDEAPIEMAAPTVTALPEERLLELPLQARGDEAYLRSGKLGTCASAAGALRQLAAQVEVVEVATELAAALAAARRVAHALGAGRGLRRALRPRL